MCMMMSSADGGCSSCSDLVPTSTDCDQLVLLIFNNSYSCASGGLHDGTRARTVVCYGIVA